MTFCMCLVQSLYKAVPSTRIIVSPPVMSQLLHWQYILLLSERENLCAWEFVCFSVCFFSVLLHCTGCALNYYSIYHYCQSETICVRESFFLFFFPPFVFSPSYSIVAAVHLIISVYITVVRARQFVCVSRSVSASFPLLGPLWRSCRTL